MNPIPQDKRIIFFSSSGTPPHSRVSFNALKAWHFIDSIAAGGPKHVNSKIPVQRPGQIIALPPCILGNN